LTFASGMLNDFGIGRAIKADIGDVLHVYASLLEMTNRAAPLPCAHRG
jgi:hypothetical protein